MCVAPILWCGPCRNWGQRCRREGITNEHCGTKATGDSSSGRSGRGRGGGAGTDRVQQHSAGGRRGGPCRGLQGRGRHVRGGADARRRRGLGMVSGGDDWSPGRGGGCSCGVCGVPACPVDCPGQRFARLQNRVARGDVRAVDRTKSRRRPRVVARVARALQVTAIPAFSRLRPR